MRTFLREILGTALLAVAIFLVLHVTVQSFIVVGSSMKPSLHDGQRLLISKATYFFHEPEQGDMIVFRLPTDPQTDYIKRIIASPGDTVEIKMGTVYVNGSPLAEPYIKDKPDYQLPLKKIPENNYFVLGDNRNNSNDSHNGWTVPRQNVIGKSWLSIWPPRDWGLVTHYPSGQATNPTARAITSAYTPSVN